MRVQRVPLHRGRDRAFGSIGAVRARIDEATRASVELLVLERTVGEADAPTTARDWPDFVAYAKSRVKEVAIETDATPIDDALAERLAAAGLDVAHVTRGASDPFPGVRALLRAGVRVELHAPLLRSTLEAVPRLPDELVAALGADHGVAVIRVSVPLEARRGEPVSYAEAAPVIEALCAKARLAHISVGLAADGVGIPPCAFVTPPRELWSDASPRASAPGFRRLPPCEVCAARARCPGIAEVYLRSRPAHELHPIRDTEPGPRRLSTIPPRAEPLARELRVGDVVRVGFVCNQACTFCEVATYLPTPSDEAVREAIAAALREAGHVVLSGGEPTLNPRLPDYVRLAEGRAILETNGVALSEPRLVDALCDAGLRRAVVSLHGSSEEVEALVTRTPGAFERRLAGIDALHARGVEVTVRFVRCEANEGELARTQALVAERWPGARVDVRTLPAR